MPLPDLAYLSNRLRTGKWTEIDLFEAADIIDALITFLKSLEAIQDEAEKSFQFNQNVIQHGFKQALKMRED